MRLWNWERRRTRWCRLPGVMDNLGLEHGQWHILVDDIGSSKKA